MQLLGSAATPGLRSRRLDSVDELVLAVDAHLGIDVPAMRDGRPLRYPQIAADARERVAPCQHLKNLSLSGSKAELLDNDAALFYQRFASRIAESVPGGVRIRGNKVLPVEK